VRYGEDEEEQPAKVRNARISYQLASLVFVLISMDNLLRWLEQSYWFWLCSGRMAMVVLFGAALRQNPIRRRFHTSIRSFWILNL
jgi:hypothetical protein